MHKNSVLIVIFFMYSQKRITEEDRIYEEVARKFKMQDIDLLEMSKVHKIR